MSLKLIPTAHELIVEMKGFFLTTNSRLNYQNEEPLRAELFSSDQMDRFGKNLAKNHKLSTRPVKEHLLKRLADNEVILNEVRKLLTDSIKKGYQITPAGEWLIDNFYLIEENIRSAKVNFPKGYSKDLPQLSDEGSSGLTRIYDIVLQIISHSDGRIDMESLSRFINAYQSVNNLQLGELWAIPIMLRLALIENLRRVSARVAIDRVDGNLADYWAKKMIETAERAPKDQILVIADMARSDPPMVSAFVSELIRQLQGKGPDLALALNWIEQQLADSGITSVHLVNAENQKKAADQVSMSNSIGSLRLLGSMDWRDFVESHSIVEQTLREDSGGMYGLMDFTTRDRYRHVVEKIAKESPITENQVARTAIKLMKEKLIPGEHESWSSHVGYYLVGPGVEQTKRVVKIRESIGQKIMQYLHKHRLKVYLISIISITIVTSILILSEAKLETNNGWLLSGIVLLSLLSTSQLAISFVNFISTLLVKPNLLPRMDFSKGIPRNFRTMVVIPVMLTTEDEIENLVEALEVRFLANINEYLHFALLTDFTDAVQEVTPGDHALIQLAQQRIEELNDKYGREKNDLFYLFHRPRHWNKSENAWMGYERKRGKISELNELLRGGAKDRFSLIIGDQSIFPFIKYVITLDADTQLPMGSAWKLIGSMAHPLNHPLYDAKKKRVTNGYGILQPRVTNSLPDETSSFYTRMHGNEPGIDPYTRASSDVYQDLFEEGSFIGKGIYDVDIFKKVLDGAFAENSILSHDLLEGCYIRSGLVSDVQLFEKYPGTYRADIKRQTRWVRGDWQIFSWWLPFIHGVGKGWNKNPLSGLSRWKIFDNIRRSIVPAALTIMLLLGWLVMTSALYWTIVVSLIIIGPILITSIWDAFNKPKEVILKHHVKNSIRSIFEIFKETLFTLICLPYVAYVNLRCILVTLWRMLITRRNMLEWNPFVHEKNISGQRLTSSYSEMWIEVFLPVCVLILLIIQDPVKLFIAGPILFLWLTAPWVTWWVSKPLSKQVVILNHEQNIFLQKLSRRTWNFFERFVGADDNWLPPDNFQEQPIAMIAHRTSPTNIGISLLANLAANDFGYITTGQLIERTEKTIGTLKKLEQFKGHFYNWYDTQSLNPLLPKYISTVDSGNLAAHLLVLRQGLIGVLYQKIQSSRIFKGLRDTLFILIDSLSEKEASFLESIKLEIDSVIKAAPMPPDEIKLFLDVLDNKVLIELEKTSIANESEPARWKQIWIGQVEALRNELKIFAPWNLLKNVPEEFVDLQSGDDVSSYANILKTAEWLQSEGTRLSATSKSTISDEWLSRFQSTLTESITILKERINSIESLAYQCNKIADMEWDFLYDSRSHLFTIGYNVMEHRIDTSYYDLLASEARLAVFVCIAQGKLPEEAWFALGRLLTNVEGNSILLSWSGSMFEYLMPLLVMPSFENTLLDQTYKSAVKWQIEYGNRIGLPWGISESGYNRVNAHSHYQYRAFGAPGMGLKRGLEDDSVIAPYATAMALMVSAEKACDNLELLEKNGFNGRYGFYEAIDYTPSRLPRGQSKSIVYSFMTHHQGMSLLSYAYLLLDKPMQKLFEAEPRFKAALLLLQERIPKASTYFTHTTAIAEVEYISGGTETRIIKTANTPIPEVQLLSNGRYHVMLSNAGSGYSRWKDLAVTRWREDGTCDPWGTFCYIRDLDTNAFWSNTHQPTLKKTEKYEVSFSQGRVDFHIMQNGIETNTEIVVSPEDDIEMRRVLIKNYSDTRRTIDVTSYAEVVLTAAAADIMQPAFNNLFVQSKILPKKHAILCTRRPRSAEEQVPWMFHLMTMHGKVPAEISYETDRMEFIGRGNSTMNPRAMQVPGPLAGHEGSVLNPIVAIRYKIILEPDERITLDMITGIAESSTICESLINKYQDKHHKDRVFEMAWTHSQVVLRQINATEADAQLYGRLASSILFSNPLYRADPSILINNHRRQSGLWSYSISGDLPIVILKIENQTNMHLVKQLVQAHAFWRLKGLAVDLVIWNEEHNVYRQVFQNDIQALIPAELRDRPGGIFVRASEQISNEDRILFQTVARINIPDNKSLENFVKLKSISKQQIPFIIVSKKINQEISNLPIPGDLIFYNGKGGFTPDGNEYVIILDSKNQTPAPWVNVIANPGFGTVISESGSSYTWTENAHELRLTPWHNDPVCDPGGEAFYIRDDESGQFWTASYLPARSQSNYITKHGFGYSVFEHIEAGIYSEMTVHVDLEASIKFTKLKIRNHSGRSRKLSVTGYIEWVLGDSRSKTAMHIHTEIDPDSGVFFAKNHYSTEFFNHVAFFDTDESKNTFTADRTEFIGRNGTLQSPEAMGRTNLSGKIGLALDPCAAILVPFTLADGDEREIIFRLGAGKDAADANSMARKFRGNAAANESLEKVKNYWKRIIGSLQVETPDAAINILTNGWLIYQTLSSRLWGRSGFYQSGGAFGFRDQLQDVMSLIQTSPILAKDQILLSASRQFRDGDVQHWWHPPTGRGVRTRCSDDYLWLPMVTSVYISKTGDQSILDERVHYLEGRSLAAEEESYYDLPIQSLTSASLYDHCVQAIRHGFTYGEHGIPLIGSGDWNDGYDKVGIKGKGESVWMAFFLYDILTRFEPIATGHNDITFAQECKKAALQLKENIDTHAWDGSWYKRAWFDDGAELGTSTNDECRIDSIAQSWSVLSGAGDDHRIHNAMDSAYKYLVRKDVGIIQLLQPPFDKSELNPGYIKGYVPGVRENGGQYTHAAVWMIMAFAKLGDNKRVWELLNMINPINHGKDSKSIAVYKVEPYVLAADVYAGTQHAGRGGWTWYTGSAGWMYRLITESLLGIQQEGNYLKIHPCIPPEWDSFKVRYQFNKAQYHIEIIQKDMEDDMMVVVDGKTQEDNRIKLIDEEGIFKVQIMISKSEVHNLSTS
ncbi:MAG: glucoamylase family protein [Saprospiraceae bacterium]